MSYNHLKEDTISFLEDQILIENMLSRFEGKEASRKAKKLLTKYGSLSGIIAEEQACIKEYAGLSEESMQILKTIKEGIRRIHKNKISKVPILRDVNSIVKYCNLVFEGNKKEVFAIFYLNHQYKLTYEEFLSDGALSFVNINPTDLIRKALIYRSKGILLAHNHPSGNIYPSIADIHTTAELYKKLAFFDIKLLDHLIINEKKYYSFRAHLSFNANQSPFKDQEYNYKLEYIKSLIKFTKKDEFAINIKRKLKVFKDLGIETTEEWVNSFQDNFQYEKLPTINKMHLKMLNYAKFAFFCYLDQDLKFQFASKSYENIVNFATEGIIGKSLQNLIGEDNFTICKPFIERAMQGEEVTFQYLWESRKDKFIPLKLSYLPNYNKQTNTVKGIYAFTKLIEINSEANVLPYYSCIPSFNSTKEVTLDTKFLTSILSQVEEKFQSHHLEIDYNFFTELTNHLYKVFYYKRTIDQKYLTRIIAIADSKYIPQTLRARDKVGDSLQR